MTTRVFEYSLGTPLSDPDPIEEQLRLYNRAVNVFKGVKHKYNELRDKLMSEIDSPDLVNLKKEFAVAFKEGDQDVLDRLRKKQDRLNDQYGFKDLQQQEYEECKKLAAIMQSEWGLYWGTKAAAKDRVYPRGKQKRVKRLDYRPFDGTGVMRVQDADNKKPTCGDLFLGKWSPLKLSRDTVSIRYGGGRGEPIKYATFPLRYHRPLPADGRVTDARVIYKYDGPTLSRYLQITVKDLPTPEPANSSIVAVDLGWKKTPGGIRCVTWVGSDGVGGHEYCPPEWQNAAEYLKALDSVRSNAFNECRDSIKRYVKSHVVPGWLEQVCSHIHAWESPKRLYNLCEKWEPHAGDSEIYLQLREFCRLDKRRHQEKLGINAKLDRKKKDWYRKLCHRLSERYGTIILDEINLKDIQESDDTYTNYNKNIARPSLFRQCNKIREYEGKLDLRDTSRQCHLCSEFCETSPNHMLECDYCLERYDRDLNACINMLARADVRVEMPESLERLMTEEFPAKYDAQRLCPGTPKQPVLAA